MNTKDIRQDIEGYDRLQNEIEILRKYSQDYTAHKGRVARIISQLHPKKLNLRVSEIIRETDTTRTLRFVSGEQYLPPFQAGQYINLFVEVDGIRTSRPYSISSPPNQIGYYDLTIRRVADGFVSNYLLDEIQVGDIFTSTGPAGQFVYNPMFHERELVFMAGGSGITPFMSMIREVTDRGLDRNITLVYGSRVEEDIIFKTELEERAARHQNLSVHPVISEPTPGYSGLTGFITSELIQQILGDTTPTMFYICGPEIMYDFCLAELKKVGVQDKRIRREAFGPPQDPSTLPDWPDGVSRDKSFEVRVKGRTIEARADEPLLISLERAGLATPCSCRSGECSLCRVKLISGRVFQPRQVKLRKSDRDFGYIHACLAYPLEDLEILL